MREDTLLDEIKRNDRYFVALLAAFVLGLLLLFYEHLSPWIQSRFVPAYVVYVTGVSLIGQLQNMVGNRTKLRCDAAQEQFVGTPRWFFSLIVFTHIAWFAAFILFSFKSLPPI